ncbi:Carbonic anhydrase [Mycobacteroides abscessus subsp. abscessus]|nr:Carbonic anhydrase [Mycobacteroides abscessus subsp. abscessus]
MVILTCMDTRLLELLPKAINVANGDVKIIKNAGALVAHPFGSIMRSILVAVYQLQADEVFVIGHHDCGMSASSIRKQENWTWWLTGTGNSHFSFFSGTGSKPPGWNGWHFVILRTASQPPLKGPNLLTASRP